MLSFQQIHHFVSLLSYEVLLVFVVSENDIFIWKCLSVEFVYFLLIHKIYFLFSSILHWIRSFLLMYRKLFELTKAIFEFLTKKKVNFECLHVLTHDYFYNLLDLSPITLLSPSSLKKPSNS